MCQHHYGTGHPRKRQEQLGHRSLQMCADLRQRIDRRIAHIRRARLRRCGGAVFHLQLAAGLFAGTESLTISTTLLPRPNSTCASRDLAMISSETRI